MTKFISRYLALFVAATIAITTFSPHLYGYLKFHTQYTPFSLYEKNQYQRDELYAYAAQVQQVLKGNFIGDTYIWENRNSSSPFFSEFISVLPIVFLSLLLGSVKTAFAVSDLIFPATLFFIIYLFLKSEYPRIFSILAAASVVLLPFFSTLIPFIFKGGYLWTGTTQDPLLITRTPHPQISLIFLFLALFAAAGAISVDKNKKLRKLAVIAGVSLYSSVFVSSTVIFALVLLAPLLIKSAQRRELMLAIMIFIFVASPWIYNFLSYQQLLKETDFFLRASNPMEILFPRQLRYVFFAFILYFFTKSSVSKAIIAFTVSAGAFMDFHQILLGRSIDADHWISRILAPVTTLTVLLLFDTLIKKSKRFAAITSVILVLVISTGIFSQFRWINNNKDLLVPDFAKAELFKKINTVTKKDDVIAATTLDLNQFIPGATGRYIYIGPPERPLMDSSEHQKRICDIFQISNEKNLNSQPDELLDQEIDIEKWKLNEDINKDTFLSKCFSNSHQYYNIDFLIDRRPDGGYELIKY